MKSSVENWMSYICSISPSITSQDVDRAEKLVDELSAHKSFSSGERISQSALLALKKKLALTLPARSSSLASELLMQFVCGYYDLDFRDAIGHGHGELILKYANEEQLKRWEPRIRGGGLVGVMLTEPQGGSRASSFQTIGTARKDSVVITGEKVWVSRLAEFELAVLFYSDLKDRRTQAIVIETGGYAGMAIESIKPAGLSGWTWGRVKFSECAIPKANVIDTYVQGREMIEEHFARYRYLVTAGAVGAAAKILELVLSNYASRAMDQNFHIRDTALEKLSRAFAAVNRGLAALFTLDVMQQKNPTLFKLLALSQKAAIIDEIYELVSDVSKLQGAQSYAEASVYMKTLNDLRGYLFADGIHDSLHRKAGKILLGIDS